MVKPGKDWGNFPLLTIGLYILTLGGKVALVTRHRFHKLRIRADPFHSDTQSPGLPRFPSQDPWICPPGSLLPSSFLPAPATTSLVFQLLLSRSSVHCLGLAMQALLQLLALCTAGWYCSKSIEHTWSQKLPATLTSPSIHAPIHSLGLFVSLP